MSSSSEAYMIVLTDGDSEVYTYSLPADRNLPYRVYPTVAAAKQALAEYAGRLQEFHTVAYGQAFPYEHTSFEQELAQKGFGAVGWFRYTDSASGESIRIKLGILRLASSAYSG